MDPLVYLLGGAGVVQTGAIVYFVVQLIRLGDKYHEEKDRVRDATQRCQQCEAQYQTTAREFAEYVRRTKLAERDLRNDIAELETDLARSARPGDINRRIQRLLSKAKLDDAGTANPNDHGGAGVPPGPAGAGS